MNKLKISAKELRAIGYPENPVIAVAMNVMEKHFKHHQPGSLRILFSSSSSGLV